MNDYLAYRQKLKLEGKPPKEKKRVKIAPYSKKRQRANREYAKVSKPLWEGQPCQIRSKLCTGRAQGIHHPKGKGTIDLLVDPNNMISCCHACNGWCESNHAEAEAAGFKKSRLKKEQ